MNRFYTRKNINIGAVVSLTIIIFFAWYAYLSMMQARKETRKVNESLLALRTLEDVMDDMQDIETGHRGYIISRNQQFLHPYHKGLEKLRTDTPKIKSLYSIYPHRTGIFDSLLGLINAKVALSGIAVGYMESNQYPRASGLVQTGKGRELMDSIRSIILSIENEDRLVLNQSNSNREVAATNTARLFIILAVIFSIIAIMLYWRITKELKFREDYQGRMAYLASLVDKTSDAIISTNSEGVIISWNKGAEAIYGFSQEEAVGKPATKITGSKMTEEKSEELRAELNKKGYLELELYHKNRKGEDLYCLAAVSPLRNEENKTTGYVSVIRDITQRKLSEKLLQEFNEELAVKIKEKTDEIRRSEEKYTSMVEQASDGIFIMDREGRYIDANSAGCSLVGYTREEILTMSATDFLSEGNLPMPVEKYDELKEGKIIIRERELRRKDGTTLIAEASYKMLPTGEVMAITRDVTERKRSEKKLKESEEKLRHILSSTPDDFYVIDLQYRVTLINKRAELNLERIWGKPVKLGTHILEAVPPERKEEIRKNFIRAFAGERIEYEVENKSDGKKASILVSYTPIYNEEQVITGASVITKDITEWKRAENELRQINNRFEMIGRTTNDAVWEWDLETNNLWSNLTHQQLYGLTMDDPVPSEAMWASRIHPDDRQAVVNTQTRILASDKNVFISEYRFNVGNGEYRDIYDRCYIMRDENGKPVRMMGSMMDITERKRAEQATRDSEETQKLIMNSALDAIVCIGHTGKIIVWTPQAEKIFGWSEREVLGKELADTIIPHAYRKQHREGLEHYLATGEHKILNRIIEMTALNRKGDEFPVELSITPVKQGNGIFFCAFIRDITERKKSEIELRHSEERYRALVENAPEALVVFDMEQGRFVSVSKSAEKLFKLTEEELLQTGPVRLSPEYQPDGRLSAELAFEKINEAINGGKPSFEWMHIDSEGHQIMCEVRLARLPSEKSILIRGSIVDIEERKKAEKALQESEERYRTFFENSLDGILLTSPDDGLILSANPAACAMFQRTEVEIIESGRAGLVDQTDPRMNFLIEMRRTKGKATGELNMVRKDGSIFPSEVSSAIFVDAFGRKRTIMIVRDITERKKAEQEIREINARFDIVSKATSDIVWDWDLTANTVWWNVNYYENLGYRKTTEHINIEEWFTHIHPADVGRVRSKLKKVFAGKSTVWRDEYRYTHADGTYLHFLDRGFIMRDNSGKAIRMIGSMVDMTLIYNAQREVAESENRLRTILDTDPECIKLMGPECELHDINQAGLAMLEADSIESVRGKSILSVVEPSQRTAAASLIKDAFSGKPGKMEFEMITLKGTKRWCEINMVPFKNAEGEIVYALGVTIDITDKRNAELELKRNEEKYRTLVEQAVDAIALYDLNGNILDVNSGTTALLGYSKEELATMNLGQILLPEDMIENPIRYDILQKNESTVKERRMRRKDGTIVVTEVRSQQLPDGRFLSVVRDMSERIMTQEELQASYKAVRKLTAHLQNVREEERSDIAREIHDELGQQLTVLKMDVSWINKRLTDADDAMKEKLRELLTMLDNTVRTVRRISSELRPSLLDDLGLIAAMEWQLNEFEKRSGIQTRLFAPEKEVNLSGPVKTALFRIFQESLTNVARHAEAKNISINLEQKNDSFVLSIADDGKGFDRQKVAEKRTLGILGMNERTAMIGGQYEIVSEPGKGTRVSVSVPLNGNQ